ncbi:MAG: outer membrane lipid asymmetry maintenance protein MlaD [Nitrospira bacterium SG8_35_1]|jgi:phospholipid/cholesterol/gamma-HCH transport system substrate-binding protein|nr:MAG: outer membrane lipid asymmetry maintenance protein MlaD [Nitrospira bacterium SG8_35_1]
MKKINTEFVVGLFMLAGFLAFAYLSSQMGEFSVFSLERNYQLEAQFDNVSGLKVGATIEIAGVTIGKVSEISLGKEGLAKVALMVNQGVDISSDAIASIRTQGLIGDKYIKIIQGADEEMLADGGEIFDTESAIDFEELVSKYIFESD